MIICGNMYQGEEMTNRVLPWSQGRYIVSETADVYDNGNLLVSIIQDGKQMLALDWFRGSGLYEVGLVVACAFCNVDYDETIVEDVKNSIKVIYRDGNVSNVFPTNITYLFNRPIEASSHPTFYLIPCYPSYLISRDGRLLSLYNGLQKSWSVLVPPKETNKRPGYEYSMLYEKSRSSIGYRHRLLCLVFKDFDLIYDKAVVNHIDGNKANNCLGNLEWVSYSDNNRHAWTSGLVMGRDKVLVKNLKTGLVKGFRSLRECGRWLGEDSARYVSLRLMDNTAKVWPDLLAFKLNDGTEWPDFQVHVTCEEDVHAVVARNVFTDDLFIFENCKSAQMSLNIPSRLVLDHCRHEKLLPVNGFNFRFMCSQHTWPKHTDLHLEVYKKSPLYPRNGMFVHDSLDGTKKFFATVTECSEAIGISKTTMATLASIGAPYQKRYRFEYFDLKKSLQESISSEASKEERSTTIEKHREMTE
jgi:hypothetical protein